LNKETSISDVAAAYQARDKVCLFTGAGVSYTQDERFRAPGWRQLLREVLVDLRSGISRETIDSEFESIEANDPDLWAIATTIKKQAADEDAFLEALRRVVLKENESVDQYGRLKRRNLEGAKTLNAVVAFCSEINEIQKRPCFAINRRIAAVLTANYDYFLEAAGTLKHEADRFKPMTRPWSRVKGSALPIYHIHGYLPFGKAKKGEDRSTAEVAERKRTAVDLVLDNESYDRAYQPGSWTVEIIRRYLGSYTTVFIGFSFKDAHFLEAAQEISSEGNQQTHFALLKRGDAPSTKLVGTLSKAGIQPVFYEDHCQVPSLLAQVYESALPREGVLVPRTGREPRRFKPSEIWDLLWQDKRWIDSTV
jgi:hypothetical protein